MSNTFIFEATKGAVHNNFLGGIRMNVYCVITKNFEGSSVVNTEF